ncbi:Uncharacterised protein [Candidatus Gugararchaeum adminiculabundum]|nr:Uncharacterised protein [Candidatus Gugararchaeum adminiculabundum]
MPFSPKRSPIGCPIYSSSIHCKYKTFYLNFFEQNGKKLLRIKEKYSTPGKPPNFIFLPEEALPAFRRALETLHFHEKTLLGKKIYLDLEENPQISFLLNQRNLGSQEKRNIRGEATLCSIEIITCGIIIFMDFRENIQGRYLKVREIHPTDGTDAILISEERFPEFISALDAFFSEHMPAAKTFFHKQGATDVANQPAPG